MRVIVIGCGAAGAAAAIAAARAGHRVTVLDRNRKPLKKLGVTGNGRGNLLNRGQLRYYGQTGFALSVLEHTSRQAVETFLESAGISLTEEDEGRVYPACYQASAAVDALLAQMDALGVERRQNVRVTALRREDGGFVLEGTESVYGEEKSKKNGKIKKGELLEERPVCFHAERVIAAFGGAAAPAHGTDGTAYGLLTALGHTLHTPRPALCPLTTSALIPEKLAGQRVRAHLTLLDENGNPLDQRRGELLFTADGVSGIAAMQLARSVRPGHILSVDLTEALTGAPDADAAQWLRLRLAQLGDRPAARFFAGAAVPALAEALLRQAGLPMDGRPAAAWTSAEIQALSRAIRNFRLPLSGVRGFDAAQVTAGGIDAAEFDPATMESRLVPGLYAAGELLDVDGDCGGYNLLFAFATGQGARLRDPGPRP